MEEDFCMVLIRESEQSTVQSTVQSTIHCSSRLFAAAKSEICTQFLHLYLQVCHYVIDDIKETFQDVLSYRITEIQD